MHLIASNWILWLATPANWPIILAVAGGLGFVIFVHELGHFLVAKACGVKCEKFYLGFDIYGLKLCKFQWGETEYGIGILPLGGYVKMLGQDDNPARMAEETRRAQLPSQAAGASADRAPPLTHGDLPSEPVSNPHVPYDPRSYMAQSVPKRMAIISAGVIMNVIFAVLMATVAYALGVPETPCVVGGTLVGGAAWQAGLEPGDKITRIGKLSHPRFEDLKSSVTLGDVKDGIRFTVERFADNKSQDITLYPDSSLGLPMIGISGGLVPTLNRPGFPPTVPLTAARRATPAFKVGDTIVQINQTPIHDNRDLELAFAKYVDEPIHVTVNRIKEGEKDKAVAQAGKKPPTESIDISVQPTPLLDIGLMMPLGPIAMVQKNSPAERAGLKVGEKIVAVGGQPVGNPFTLEQRLLKSAAAGKTVTLKIDRSGAAGTEVTLTPQVQQFPELYQDNSPLALSAIGVACEVPPTVVAVQPGSAAAAADIQPGDEIVSEKPVAPAKLPGPPDLLPDEELGSLPTVEFGKKLSWPGYILGVLSTFTPDMKVQLTVKRGDKTHTVELGLAEMKDDKGDVMHTPSRGFYWAQLTIMHQAESWGEAVHAGAAQTVDSLLMVYRFLQKIGTQIPVTMLSGPVGIIQQAGYEAQQGFAKFLLFLTLLSANLAVVNFLPIPVLDGGHMVFLLYEGLRGKPASERIVVGFTYAGLIFLLSLMLFVLALDTGLISRL
jgi:regulator of sigma E protease